MENKQQKHFEGTPEEFLVVDDIEMSFDAINCAVTRANATLNLLHCHFSNCQSAEGNNIHRLTDSSVVDALWAVRGYLDQISVLTKTA